MLLAGRLILGVGGAFIVANTPVVIAHWFTRKELGKAMGIYGINMPFATVIAFPSVSVSMLAYGWRFLFFISLAIGIVATVVFLVAIREGQFEEHERKACARQAVVNFEIWKVGLVWLFFNTSVLSFTTWAPNMFETYKGVPQVYSILLQFFWQVY
jgi:MFS family permease